MGWSSVPELKARSCARPPGLLENWQGSWSAKAAATSRCESAPTQPKYEMSPSTIATEHHPDRPAPRRRVAIVAPHNPGATERYSSTEARLQHAGRSRRRPARSRHRRARDADLPDHGLRVRGRRPRRGAVQPAGLRQHLFAHHESRPMRCWRSASPRWKAAAPRWPSASGHAAQLLALHTLMSPGDEYRRGAPALWRLDQPVQPGLRQVRLAREMGRHRPKPDSFKAQIDDRRPRPIFIESIANPGGIITDIEAIAGDRRMTPACR